MDPLLVNFSANSAAAGRKYAHFPAAAKYVLFKNLMLRHAAIFLFRPTLRESNRARVGAAAAAAADPSSFFFQLLFDLIARGFV
jgi:hypothetical protein